jgi:hypothetical protein
MDIHKLVDLIPLYSYNMGKVPFLTKAPQNSERDWDRCTCSHTFGWVWIGYFFITSIHRVNSRCTEKTGNGSLLTCGVYHSHYFWISMVHFLFFFTFITLVNSQFFAFCYLWFWKSYMWKLTCSVQTTDLFEQANQQTKQTSKGEDIWNFRKSPSTKEPQHSPQTQEPVWKVVNSVSYSFDSPRVKEVTESCGRGKGRVSVHCDRGYSWENV